MYYYSLESRYANTVRDFGDKPVYETRSRTSGTYRIATYIREEFDLDVEVIDFIFSWTLDELSKKFAEVELKVFS